MYACMVYIQRCSRVFLYGYFFSRLEGGPLSSDITSAARLPFYVMDIRFWGFLPRRREVFLYVTPGLQIAAFTAVIVTAAELENSLGFSPSAVGAVGAAHFLGVVVASLLLSGLSDRGYSRFLLRAGLLLSAVSQIVALLAPNVAWFVVSQLLAGVGLGMSEPAVSRRVAAGQREHIGRNLGVLSAFKSGIGGTVGPGLGAAMLAVFGFRSVFASLAVLYLVALGGVWRLDMKDGKHSAGAGKTNWRTAAELVSHPGMQGGILSALSVRTQMGVFNAGWAFLLAGLGAAVWMPAGFFALAMTAMMVCGPLGGIATQRYGASRVLTVSLGAGAALTMLYSDHGLMWTLIAAAALHAAANGVSLSGQRTAVALFAPAGSTASALGLLAAVNATAEGASVLAGGVLYDLFGPSVLYPTAGLFAATLAAWSRIRYRQAETQP